MPSIKMFKINIAFNENGWTHPFTKPSSLAFSLSLPLYLYENKWKIAHTHIQCKIGIILSPNRHKMYAGISKKSSIHSIITELRTNILIPGNITKYSKSDEMNNTCLLFVHSHKNNEISRSHLSYHTQLKF